MPCWAPAEPDHLTPEGALLGRTRRLALDCRARRAGAAPHPEERRRGLHRPGESPPPWGLTSRGSGLPGNRICREGAAIALPVAIAPSGCNCTLNSSGCNCTLRLQLHLIFRAYIYASIYTSAPPAPLRGGAGRAGTCREYIMTIYLDMYRIT